MQQEVVKKNRQLPTLPPIKAVPSALVGLTSLFGMGRGDHHRHYHLIRRKVTFYNLLLNI
jgi:hypothetical protein